MTQCFENMIFLKFDIAVVVDYCGVGLRDGRIPDGAITASSMYDPNHAPAQARLDYTGNSVVGVHYEMSNAASTLVLSCIFSVNNNNLMQINLQKNVSFVYLNKFYADEVVCKLIGMHQGVLHFR